MDSDTRMETGLCRHFKFGFCRFGDLCHRRHIKEICGNKVCPDVNVCPLRHPKICSFFTKYGNCKFGLYCSYGHEKSAMQTKIENLESELQNLTSEIKDLKGQIKLIQQQLQDTTSATHLPPPSAPVPVPPHSSLLLPHPFLLHKHPRLPLRLLDLPHLFSGLNSPSLLRLVKKLPMTVMVKIRLFHLIQLMK